MPAHLGGKGMRGIDDMRDLPAAAEDATVGVELNLPRVTPFGIGWQVAALLGPLVDLGRLDEATELLERTGLRDAEITDTGLVGLVFHRGRCQQALASEGASWSTSCAYWLSS